jgi:ribosomal protein S28E/S33
MSGIFDIANSKMPIFILPVSIVGNLNTNSPMSNNRKVHLPVKEGDIIPLFEIETEARRLR